MLAVAVNPGEGPNAREAIGKHTSVSRCGEGRPVDGSDDLTPKASQGHGAPCHKLWHRKVQLIIHLPARPAGNIKRTWCPVSIIRLLSWLVLVGVISPLKGKCL